MSQNAIKILVAIIGAAGVIIAALISAGVFHLFSHTNYPQLNGSYTGSATGYSSGPLSFTLGSEDQQGNISMQVDYGQAIYACSGDITLDKNLVLDCSKQGASNYLLSVKGFIYPDGHIAGTMVGTNTQDINYVHNYTWSAS